ncbi:MAG: hypothetical protein ABSC32_07435 [Steroidobacteraceae bacterium]
MKVLDHELVLRRFRSSRKRQCRQEHEAQADQSRTHCAGVPTQFDAEIHGFHRLLPINPSNPLRNDSGFARVFRAHHTKIEYKPSGLS